MRAIYYITPFLLIGFAGNPSHAIDGLPTLAWETETIFKQPESAIYDEKRDILYVSNINGEGMAKDGNGFISKLELDGTVTELEWVKGLDGPKGLTISGDKLYASDITALVEIDIEQGTITNRYEAEGAQFMNDVAADANGNVYVSDMITNTIHRLSDGAFSVWIHDEQLENPNGLHVEDDKIILGAWGNMKDDFSTEVPGNLKTISLADGTIKDLGNGMAVGNLDGVEADGNGNYYVTDWMAGTLMHIKPSGEAQTLLELGNGSADHEVLLNQGIIIIPMMKNDKVLAYKIAQ
ncbi:MAG: SMP-30/gluconolactonase/LRE family protein [Gammaproteobacteria bacterium]|nr:SMP-30/gluconolactonase/LRE family protein [Gammaproteobacteria bacterium]